MAVCERSSRLPMTIASPCLEMRIRTSTNPYALACIYGQHWRDLPDKAQYMAQRRTKQEDSKYVSCVSISEDSCIPCIPPFHPAQSNDQMRGMRRLVEVFKPPASRRCSATSCDYKEFAKCAVHSRPWKPCGSGMIGCSRTVEK